MNMAKKFKINFDSDIVRIILIVIGSVFSTLVLVFSVLSMSEAQVGNVNGAANYLLAVFMVLAVTRFFTYLKERTLLSFYRFLILFIFNVAIGIMVSFGHKNLYLFPLCGALYCLTIVISRLFKLVRDHSVRSIVFNAILITLFSLLALGLFIPNDAMKIGDPIVVICLIAAISAFIEVISNATRQLKLNVLLKIVVRTFALEILLGMLTLMVAFSLIFMLYEDDIATFGEGLWYSFAVVTTIGFGDYTTKTLVGRVLTVFLGMYGIVVVAVITSIIVNFYNETAGKNDSKRIQDIKDEQEKKKKK